MTKDVSTMVAKMNQHWEFLKAFIFALVDKEVIDVKGMTDFDIELIEYGFKLAWPHAWKHGQDQNRREI